MSDTPKHHDTDASAAPHTAPEQDTTPADTTIPVLMPDPEDSSNSVAAASEPTEPAATDTAPPAEDGSDTKSSTNSAKPTQHQPTSTTTASSGIAKLALIGLLLITVLLAGVGYWLYPQYQQWHQAEDRYQAVLNSLTLAQQQLNDQAELLQDYRQQQSQQQRQVQQQLADNSQAQQGLGLQINDLQAQINSIRHTDRDDWLLAEVEYLARLAHQRLMSDRNITVAIGLLQQADAILRDMGRADLYSVRAQLRQDIQALTMTDNVDVTGTLINLQTLSAAVPHLAMLPQRQMSTPNPSEASNNATDATWYQGILEQLSSLYRVQPLSEPPEPMPDIDQIGLLKQQVKLRLVQAEYALMRADQHLYDQSLRFCIDTIQQYVDPSPNKQVFIEQITALQAVVVATDLPDITASHTAIYNYLDARRHLVGESQP